MRFWVTALILLAVVFLFGTFALCSWNLRWWGDRKDARCFGKT